MKKLDILLTEIGKEHLTSLDYLRFVCPLVNVENVSQVVDAVPPRLRLEFISAIHSHPVEGQMCVRGTSGSVESLSDAFRVGLRHLREYIERNGRMLLGDHLILQEESLRKSIRNQKRFLTSKEHEEELAIEKRKLELIRELKQFYVPNVLTEEFIGKRTNSVEEQ